MKAHTINLREELAEEEHPELFNFYAGRPFNRLKAARDMTQSIIKLNHKATELGIHSALQREFNKLQRSEA